MSFSIRARLLPMFPFSILQGGLELQCVKTCRALQRKGLDAQLLDHYRFDDQFDILHLFGSTENYYDICRQVAGRWPIIISAVTGAPSAARWRGPIWQTASSLAKVVKLSTGYSRMREVYQMSTVVICLNQLEADFLQTTYGIPAHKLKIITNGVDDPTFEADPRLFIDKYGMRNFVLYTGNIVRRKNPLRLAQALRALDIPGVFIGKTINGERQYGEEFRSIVDKAPNLLWIEGLADQDPLLVSAYAAAGLFCLPSTNETQSLSALEAMAAGTPILLGDYPYSHQTPFQEAWRCNPHNLHSLERGIRQALESGSDHQHRLPSSYRWEQVTDSIATVYRDVLGLTDTRN